MQYTPAPHNTPEARVAHSRTWHEMKEATMLSPKEAAAKKVWEAKLEYAVTAPIDHDMIADLVRDLTPDEIRAIPYLPNRDEYL